MKAGLSLRPARPADAALILDLVRELAAYERLLHEVEADRERIKAALFCEAPRVFAEIAELDGEPAGFALWFYTFSTFQGRHGLYLEDLFVREPYRGLGLGLALIEALARRCVDEGLGRFEWSVLDWNQPAIDFYESRGARRLTEWQRCRVEGEALRRLAEGRG